MLLSDVNATNFIGLAAVPIFRDPSAGRMAWSEMHAGAFEIRDARTREVIVTKPGADGKGVWS